MKLKILHVTNMYPNNKKPWYGIFISDQIESLNKLASNDVYFIDGTESKLNYIKAFKDLKKLRDKYDIIHAHHGWCGIICNRVFKGEKVIVSLVGGDLLEEKIIYKKIISRVLKKDLKKFNYIIVKSSQMLNICQNYVKNVTNIPNGVNLDVFRELDKLECKSKLHLSNNKKYFLFTAAANDKTRLEKRYDIIKGAKDILESRGVNNVEILFLQNVKHEDVPVYINACEAIVLSSDYEGSPNIVKEALACNIPIISTDVGNVKEMIFGIENCYIIEQSSEEFADTIELYLSKGINRCKGRDCIKSIGLDTESIANSILKLYESTKLL